MPPQRRPPPSPHHPPAIASTPPLSPSTPASSQPSSSSSSAVSTSESSLSTPFEHLAIADHITHRPLSHLESKQLADDAQNQPTDVYSQRQQDTDTEMFERMPQDSDFMQSRRSTPGSPSLRTHALSPHLSHSHFHSRSPVSPSVERPALQHRNTSFSKRHASFDTPREVPLPYMPSRTQNFSLASSRAGPDTDADGFGRRDSSIGGTSDSPISPYFSAGAHQTSSSPAPQYMDTSEDGVGNVPASPGATASTVTGSMSGRMPQVNRSMSGPVSSYTRPHSSGEPSRTIHSPTPVRPAVLSDRSSTQSLPLPMHTPYHTLPAVEGGSGKTSESESPSGPPSSSRLPSSAPPSQAGPSAVGTGRAESLASSESSSCNSIASSSRAALPSRPPDWLRETAESRCAPATETAMSIAPPAPPTVLTPPLPSLRERALGTAAHTPFLSQAPPPQDSYLAVETSAREYRLIARLPGFRRDSITLSTRRRRILHVVADSWEPTGGHFERRISFGYDADLTQVRAEFDGEHLRIIVPRQPLPMTFINARR